LEEVVALIEKEGEEVPLPVKDDVAHAETVAVDVPEPDGVCEAQVVSVAEDDLEGEED
jgi:hypothetical protein